MLSKPDRARLDIIAIKLARGLKSFLYLVPLYIVLLVAFLSERLGLQITVAYPLGFCATLLITVIFSLNVAPYWVSAYLDWKRPLPDKRVPNDLAAWWWPPTNIQKLEGLKHDLLSLRSGRSALYRERVRLERQGDVNRALFWVTQKSLRFLERHFDADTLEETIKETERQIRRIVSGDVQQEIRDIETDIATLELWKSTAADTDQSQSYSERIIYLKRELNDLKDWKEKIAPEANKYQKLYKEEWEPKEALKHQAPVDEAYNAARASLHAASRLQQVHQEINERAASEGWPPHVTDSLHRMAAAKFRKFFDEPAEGYSIYSDA